MKFIRCYIENFGKLHQYKVQFTDGITIIKEPNGFGKTTLTAFIKAMLYGLPKNNLPIERNDRKRYTPWQGGIYGGYLEFEHKEIIYRIERTFGETSKQDRFKLFRLNPFSHSNDFSENIGFEIFRVTSDQFDKTTYMPQIQWNTVSTAKDLRDTISNIVETTLDIGSYENAMKILKAQRAEILPYRGKSGLLYQLSDKISETEFKLHQAAKAKERLSEVKDQLREYEYHVAKKKSALTRLRDDIIVQDRSPSQSIISEQYHLINSQLQKVQKELESFDQKYPYGFPSDEEIQICNNYANQIIAADRFIEGSSDLHSLSNDLPDQEMIEEYEATSNELENLKEQLDTVNDDLECIKPLGVFPIVFGILSIILIGITYIVFQHPIPICWKTIASGLSACTVIITIISSFKNANKRNNAAILEKTAKQYKHRIYNMEQYLREEMKYYGLYEDDPIQSLTILKKHTRQYQSLNQIKKKSLFEIRKILNQYTISDYSEITTAVQQLEQDKNKLNYLLGRERNLQQQLESLNRRCFDSPIKPNAPSEPSKQEKILTAQLEMMQTEIISLHKEIALLQQESDSYITLEDQLLALKAQRSEAERQVDHIEKAINHLRSAFESLSLSVIQPLKAKFTEYVSVLLNIPIEKVFVNEDISVSVEYSGVQRPQGYFSIGELDVIALCLRLAILDVLYPDQKPPLILDDPFVNLDVENMSKILGILSEIGKSHQILYLTCHESRI